MFLSLSELWKYGSGLLECIQGKRSFSSLLEKQSINSINKVSLYSITCLKWSLKKRPKMFYIKTDSCIMQVRSIAECYFYSALIYHLSLRLFLSIFEWPLKTGFNAYSAG